MRYASCITPDERECRRIHPAQPWQRKDSVVMDANEARDQHFQRLQRTLEEGLKAIEAARTPAEAEVARLQAKARMEDLQRRWEEAFPPEAVESGSR